MKKLYWMLQSLFNRHITLVDGVYVRDDFDVTIMKPAFTVLTGPDAGVTITLLQITLGQDGKKHRFHIMLHQGKEVLTHYHRGFDAFVERVMYTVFPELKEPYEN